MKNPPQPPKTWTRVSLPVKASQLSKLNPNVLHFYILYIMYLSFLYYYNWVGIIVVVLGQTPPTLYLSGESELEQHRWICLVISHCYPSTCTCLDHDIVGWSGLDRPNASTYARLVVTLTYGLYHIKVTSEVSVSLTLVIRHLQSEGPERGVIETID